MELIPPLIVQAALNHKLNIIAITDHNASANVLAVQQAAKGSGLVVLPGMELQTREEVHLLSIFDELDQLMDFQAEIDRCLPFIPNQPEYFGEQFIVDSTGDFLRREERLLLCSAKITLSEAVKRIQALGGLAIPAHIDRQAFGLITQLGLVPAEVPFDALEISSRLTPDETRRRFPSVKSMPLIQNGDVHYLADFLGANQFVLDQPTVAEIRMALNQNAGRSHILVRESPVI